MIDAFVCTNMVNFTVALHCLQSGAERRALLLYEAGRIPAPTLPRVWARPISIWSLRLLHGLARLGRVHTLHLPHDRFNRRVALAGRHASAVAYLDDGLDTRRRVPRNFDLGKLTGRPRYHTFVEYQVLPDWLERFDVRRDTPLSELADAARNPALPLEGIDHVLIESPGLRPLQVIEGLRLEPQRTLIVRHPVASKRSALPSSYRTVDGQDYGLEASMRAARDKSFYFGETMALVFAASTDVLRHNRLFAQLDDAQRDNLVGLRWRAPADGAAAGVVGLREVVGTG